MSNLNINLKEFGLNWSINSNNYKVLPDDYQSKVNKISTPDPNLYNIEGSDITFYGVKLETYKVGGYISKGSYGSVYEVKRTDDGTEAIMKITATSDLIALIKEVLIQIIIVEISKNKDHPEIKLKGPYAPILYNFGFDPIHKRGFIVSQKMKNTIQQLVYNTSNIYKLALMLVQLSTILLDLNKITQYNHRDLKPDNCMFIQDNRGFIQVRLIDFGFSYLKYDKIIIDANRFKFGALKSRDMTQFLYALYFHLRERHHIISQPIKDLLTFPINRTVCKMYEGCKNLYGWDATYSFLNTDRFTNPNGDPDVVKRVFINVLKGLDYKSQLEYAPGMMGLFVAKPSVPIVPPRNYIYNPDTGEYVKIDGIVGRKLLKQLNVVKLEDKNYVAAGIGVKSCKEPKPVLNPKTGRCVMACPPEKIRNTSFKCVSKTKKAMRKTLKSCKEPKPVLNPKTGRCVMACPPEKIRNTSFKCVSKTKKTVKN